MKQFCIMEPIKYLFNFIFIVIICNEQIYGQNDIPKIQKDGVEDEISLIEYRKPQMNISDKVDGPLAELRQLIIVKGFDPLTLPDYEHEFQARPVLLKHDFIIKLKKGWMKELSNIQRDGDAILIPRLGTKQLIKCSLLLPQVDFNYNYNLKMGWFYRRSGKIKGNLQHFKVSFELYYDIVKKYVQMKKIDIVDDGSITVKLTGNIITDGLYQKKVREIAEKLHQKLAGVLQQKINDSIDLINEKLKPKRGHLSQEEIDFLREIENAYYNYTMPQYSTNNVKLIQGN